eukprot:355350-Chlamydomonas_euryale.AAC.2
MNEQEQGNGSSLVASKSKHGVSRVERARRLCHKGGPRDVRRRGGRQLNQSVKQVPLCPWDGGFSCGEGMEASVVSKGRGLCCVKRGKVWQLGRREGGGRAGSGGRRRCVGGGEGSYVPG